MTNRDKAYLVIAGAALLALVNVAAFCFLSLFGLFVAAASYPLAEKMLDIIKDMDVNKDP